MAWLDPEQADPIWPSEPLGWSAISGLVTLQWDGAEDESPALAYEVWRAGDVAPLHTVIAPEAGGTFEWTSAAFTPGIESSVFIRARDAWGNASDSPTVVFVPCPDWDPSEDESACNGHDEDCDGLTDEAFVGVSTTCGTGACEADGQTTCNAGTLSDSCTPGTAAADDGLCDGVDADCDGITDEDYVAVATACGIGACASTGLNVCVAGAVADTCTPSAPVDLDQSCDGIDGDCDGATDEDYAAQPTACGSGACASTGVTTCTAGTISDTCTPGSPAGDDANCDGIDDDCDAETDEAYPGGPTTCGTGACAATGVLSCVAGVPLNTCQPGAPAPNDATCDDVDDDCDGLADEDYAPRTVACGLGPCKTAVQTSCSAGIEDISCTPAPAPGPGPCDGTDRDCDGTIEHYPVCPDSIPPSWPGVVRVVALGQTSLTVEWEPASDNDAIDGYEVFVAEYGLDPFAGTPITPMLPATATSASVAGLMAGTRYAVAVRVYDLASNEASKVTSVVTASDPPPVLSPRPLSPTVASTIFAQQSFLVEGSNPPQTGVAAGTITPARAAALRGAVRTRDGSVLSGVRVSVLRRPELGSTLSREDGDWDLLVNGGGEIVVQFEREQFLTVQRRTAVRPGEWKVLEDVVMIRPDAAISTEIDLTDTLTAQWHMGQVESDEDGDRQAILVFMPGTVGTMEFADGTHAPLPDTIHVRTLEYTVGDTGPDAMPGTLPPPVMYTYAVEAMVDEAEDSEAVSVSFDPPVRLYVDNFLGFPSRVQDSAAPATSHPNPVPLGFYNTQTGQWSSMRNGQILDLLPAAGGGMVVDLDADQDESVGELAAVGIDGVERDVIATLFQTRVNAAIAAPVSLMRVELPHFTPFDCNWGGGPGSGGPPIPLAGGGGGGGGGGLGAAAGRDDDDCDKTGSIIGVQSQVLQEQVSVPGAPFSLRYSSASALTDAGTGAFPVILTGADIPLDLLTARMTVTIAGRVYTQDFTREQVTANPVVTFNQWDGRDIYGRAVRTAQRAIVEVVYVRPFYYRVPLDAQRAFGLPSLATGAEIFELTGLTSPSRPRSEVPQTAASAIDIGTWKPAQPQFGGWALGVHHMFDPLRSAVLFGDGHVRSSRPDEVTLLAGGEAYVSSSSCSLGTSLGARDNVSSGALYQQPDGSWVVAGSGGRFELRKLGPDGALRIRRETYPNQAIDMAVAPDGTIHVLSDDRIRRFPPFPPDAEAPSELDDGEDYAIGAFTNGLALAFDAAGNLFVVNGNSVLLLNADNPGAPATLFAGQLGGGTWDPSRGWGDDGPAALAQFSHLRDISIAPDGTIYLADNRLIRRIGLDGIIRTVAGDRGIVSGDARSTPGDFGPGTEAVLGTVLALEAGPDGTVFFLNKPAIAPEGGGTTYLTTRIRRLDPDGIIRPVAGHVDRSRTAGVDIDPGNGWPRHLAHMQPTAMAVDSEGRLVFLDDLRGSSTACIALRRVSANDRAFVSVGPNGYFDVPDENGSLIYRFAPDGRHVETRAVGTGRPLFTFGYDPEGNLTSIADSDSRVTTIQSSVGPGGLQTTTITPPSTGPTVLKLNADGYLESVTAPSGASTRMKYYTGEKAGLLKEFTLPGNDENTEQSRFEYDDQGRLVSDTLPLVYDANGAPIPGEKTLSRTYGEDWTEVAFATAVGLVTRYRTAFTEAGKKIITVTDPDGQWREFTRDVDGSERLEHSNGTIERTTKEPDGLLGAGAMRTKQWSTTYPDGSWSRTSSAEDYTFVTSGGDWESRTTTATVEYAVPGGGTAQRVGSAVVQRLESDTGFATTTNSPGGRVTTAKYDAEGRLIETAQAGSPTTIYEWGATGRLDSITMLGEGSAQRVVAMTYHPAIDRLSSVTVAEGSTEASTTAFAEYDADGRVTQSVLPGESVLPGGRVLSVGYTPLGQLETVIPPGKDSTGTHEFTYNARAEMVTYQPPSLTGSQGDPVTTPTHYSYDADKRLERVELPDGTGVAMRYHPAVGSCDALTPCTTGTCIQGACVDDDYQAVCGATGFPPPAGHLIGVNAGPDGAIAYCYDPFARVSVAISPDAAVGFDYDGSGLLFAESTALVSPAVTFDVARSYGPDRALAGLSVLGTPEIVTTRDDDGLPVDVRFDWPGSAALQLTYQPAPARALLDGTEVGAMSTSAVARDPFGSESEWAATWQDPTTQAVTFDWQVTREFDGLGRITDIDEAIDTAQPNDPVLSDVHYDYDTAGRLAEVWSGQILREKYVYDDNGNRLTTDLYDALGDPTDTRVGVYDLQDRLTAWTTTTASTGVYDIRFEYGENGELSRKAEDTTGGRDLQFDYDVFGNLLSVDVSDPAHPDLSSIEYRVDYRNRRIGRVPYDAQGQPLAAQTRLYAYKDQLEPIAELDGDGNVLALYAYATRAHSPDLMLRRDSPTSPWVQYRILTDHLGSVRYVVDIATGAVAQRLRYDAWGKVLEDSNPGFQPFGFAGGLYEPVTGFVRFGARDYDPEVGRWTAKDPLRFGGGDSNIYAYVGSGVTNAVDPSGLYYNGLQPWIDAMAKLPPITNNSVWGIIDDISSAEPGPLEEWTASYSLRDTYPNSCDHMYAEHYFYGRRMGLEDSAMTAYGLTALYAVTKYTGMNHLYAWWKGADDRPLLCNPCEELLWGLQGVQDGRETPNPP